MFAVLPNPRKPTNIYTLEIYPLYGRPSFLPQVLLISEPSNASVRFFYVHALARQLDTIAYVHVHVHAFLLYQADWYDATCTCTYLTRVL